MKSAGSISIQRLALKVSLSFSEIVSVAKKALVLPLIGRGKLVLFWMVTVVTVGLLTSRTVSRMAGEAESADSLASTGELDEARK